MKKEVTTESKSLHTQGQLNFTEHPNGSEFTSDLWADLGHPHIRTIGCILDFAGKEEAIANGKRIVQCWDAHDELVTQNEILKEAVERCVMSMTTISTGELDHLSLSHVECQIIKEALKKATT